jgi:hypothetical protein
MSALAKLLSGSRLLVKRRIVTTEAPGMGLNEGEEQTC